MEVSYNNLKVGETYGIKDSKYGLGYKIIGKCTRRYKSFTRFYITTTTIINKTKYYVSYESRFYINPDHIFFLLNQKEKIQKAMEQRALNIILRNITGDESFVYYLL